MPVTLLLLTILSGICLLLWGVRTVKRAILRGYGGQLQNMIASATKNRFTAMLSGLGVTMLLQSSTATALLASSFVGRAMMSAAAGVAVMIGADIGTSVIAQILSFKLDWLAPLLLSVGIIYHLMFDDGGRRRYQARILIGFGFMLTSLAIIREAAAPLQDSNVLPLILQPLESEPVLALLVAMVLTYIFHSSLSAVLLFASLAGSGILSFELGLVFIIGANIGGAFIPLIAVLKDKPAAIHVPAANLLMKLIMGLGCLIGFSYVAPFIQSLTNDTTHQLIFAHMGLNIAIGVVFIAFIKTIASLCARLIPDTLRESDDTIKPRYLDSKALGTPSIALSCAMRETLHMAEILEIMLRETFNALEDDDEKSLRALKEKDDALDALFLAVKDYIIKLSREELDDIEANKGFMILNYATNLEHCGDIIDKSLIELIRKKIHQNDHFSDEGFAEIKNFYSTVMEHFQLSQNVFLNGDEEFAQKLIDGKKKLKLAEKATAQNHMKRLKTSNAATIATSELHMDVIRDLRRINTYVSSVAYTILEKGPESTY